MSDITANDTLKPSWPRSAGTPGAVADTCTRGTSMDDPIRHESISQDVRLRWVPDYEGKYAVTETGRVFTYVYINNHSKLSWDDVQEICRLRGEGISASKVAEKFSISTSYVYRVEGGKARKTDPRKNPKELSPAKEDSGHEFVNLLGNTCYVHRLVLKAFCGECPDGMETRHLDGNPSNNNLENLRWGTRRENISDRRKNGEIVRGQEHPQAKLSNSDVLKIKDLLRDDSHTPLEIAEIFGVSKAAIYSIRRGDRWGWLNR